MEDILPISGVADIIGGTTVVVRGLLSGIVVASGIIVEGTFGFFVGMIFTDGIKVGTAVSFGFFDGLTSGVGSTVPIPSFSDVTVPAYDQLDTDDSSKCKAGRTAFSLIKT